MMFSGTWTSCPSDLPTSAGGALASASSRRRGFHFHHGHRGTSPHENPSQSTDTAGEPCASTACEVFSVSPDGRVVVWTSSAFPSQRHGPEHAHAHPLGLTLAFFPGAPPQRVRVESGSVQTEAAWSDAGSAEGHVLTARVTGAVLGAGGPLDVTLSLRDRDRLRLSMRRLGGPSSAASATVTELLRASSPALHQDLPSWALYRLCNHCSAAAGAASSLSAAAALSAAALICPLCLRLDLLSPGDAPTEAVLALGRPSQSLSLPSNSSPSAPSSWQPVTPRARHLSFRNSHDGTGSEVVGLGLSTTPSGPPPRPPGAAPFIREGSSSLRGEPAATPQLTTPGPGPPGPKTGRFKRLVSSLAIRSRSRDRARGEGGSDPRTATAASAITPTPATALELVRYSPDPRASFSAGGSAVTSTHVYSPTPIASPLADEPEGVESLGSLVGLTPRPAPSPPPSFISEGVQTGRDLEPEGSPGRRGMRSAAPARVPAEREESEEENPLRKGLIQALQFGMSLLSLYIVFGERRGEPATMRF